MKSDGTQRGSQIEPPVEASPARVADKERPGLASAEFERTLRQVEAAGRMAAGEGQQPGPLTARPGVTEPTTTGSSGERWAQVTELADRMIKAAHALAVDGRSELQLELDTGRLGVRAARLSRRRDGSFEVRFQTTSEAGARLVADHKALLGEAFRNNGLTLRSVEVRTDAPRDRARAPRRRDVTSGREQTDVAATAVDGPIREKGLDGEPEERR